MKIKREELDIYFKRVIEKLHDFNISEIEIDYDYYYIISAGKWTNFDVDPIPSVGSLVDDCEMLKKTVTDSSRFSFDDLDRISSILRAISNELSPMPKSE